MNANDIRNAKSLTPNADTTHEDARDWYDSYGWHLSTDHGDICLQAVEYDWLDGSDEGAIALLCGEQEELSHDEAAEIVERARTVREAAESLESLLTAAVGAYQAGDLRGCRDSLLQAHAVEIGHGDAPATQSLACELLSDTLIRYRVYQAADGSDLIYCGEYDTLDAAVEAAEAEPRGLPRALWDTARAAGHCGGHYAPCSGGEEDDEPDSWHGERGCHCVVRVTY